MIIRHLDKKLHVLVLVVKSNYEKLEKQLFRGMDASCINKNENVNNTLLQ